MAEDFVAVKISGLDELEKRLVEEGPKVARKVLRKSGKRGGEVMRSAIERGAAQHVETGFLEGHIVMTTKLDGSNGKLVVVIGPQGGVGYLKGSNRSKNPLDILGNGSTVTLEGSFHYASVEARMLEFGSKHQPPTPFVGPAFDASSDEALTVFVDELWNALSDLAEK
jgi:HK97 gp10 family phage protein